MMSIVKSPNASSAITTKSRAKFASSEDGVVVVDQYAWGGEAERIIPGSQSIDALISALSVDEDFAREIRVARAELAAEVFQEKECIQALRLKAGLSQKELAEMLGTQQPYIARLESGKVSPTIDTVARLSRALNRPVGDLAEIIAGHRNE